MILLQFRPVKIDGDTARISLTMGQTAIVDVSDLPLLEGRHWHARRSQRTFYAATGRPGGVTFMHRLILPPENGQRVDHIDGDGLNNRKANLRLATPRENQRNCRLRADNASGFKGVHRKSGRWVAAITVDGKSKHLGYFDTAELAYAAYCEAARAHFGEFARLA